MSFVMRNPANNFESPKLLIDRAKENICDFNTKRNAFFKTCRKVKFTDFDFQTGEVIYKVRYIDPLPGNLRTAASDAVNNLRHALDQAVHSACEVLAPRASGSCYFPFCRDSTKISDLFRNKGRCAGIAVDLIPFLLSFEPYLGGDDLLWALSRISGPNKHQVVLGAELEIPSGEYNFILHEGFGAVGVAKCSHPDNTWELARWSQGSKVEFNCNFTIFVTFARGDVVKGQVVPAFLDTMTAKIEGIVTGIEAETARILAGRG